MNGPEHYREAERLLEQARVDARDPVRKYAENVIAVAQVHATLALAAAQAAAQATAYDGDENYGRSRGWSGFGVSAADRLHKIAEEFEGREFVELLDARLTMHDGERTYTITRSGRSHGAPHQEDESA